MTSIGTIKLNKETTPKSLGESFGKKNEKTNPNAKSVFRLNIILLKNDSFFTF